MKSQQKKKKKQPRKKTAKKKSRVRDEAWCPGEESSSSEEEWQPWMDDQPKRKRPSRGERETGLVPGAFPSRLASIN